MWPKRRREEEANIITSETQNEWQYVETIEIGKNTYKYHEHHQAEYSLVLSHRQFKLTSTEIDLELQCPDDDPSFRRVKVLYDAVWVMPTLRDGGQYTILLREREGRQPKSDSDDEGTPDPEIRPCFNVVDLSKVQYCYDRLCVHYRAALGIGFYNVVEKLFMSALGDCQHVHH